MVRVRLGRSDLEVSPICYGTWQLSPRFWGEQPRDVIIAAARKAFDLGVNFFDTADAYGDGLAEQVLGEALKPLPRHRVVLATKVYHHFYPDGRRHPDLSSNYVEEECEASLRRLQTDYIDLYQCHAFDPLTDLEETTAALERLKQAGKIRAYGASNFTVEQLRAARRFGDYATLQPRYNLLQSQAEVDLLPYCRAEDIGVLVYSPLYHGLLSGKYAGTETFEDLRKSNADFQGERFRELARRVRALAPIAQAHSLSIVQLVLVVTLMSPMIHSAIVGIKNPQQIADAAGAMGKTISREDYFRVRTTLAGHES
jgi:aryl-alcohol dehydrogenase-like predicted oxidoreductase